MIWKNIVDRFISITVLEVMFANGSVGVICPNCTRLVGCRCNVSGRKITLRTTLAPSAGMDMLNVDVLILSCNFASALLLEQSSIVHIMLCLN